MLWPLKLHMTKGLRCLFKKWRKVLGLLVNNEKDNVSLVLSKVLTHKCFRTNNYLIPGFNKTAKSKDMIPPI